MVKKQYFQAQMLLPDCKSSQISILTGQMHTIEGKLSPKGDNYTLNILGTRIIEIKNIGKTTSSHPQACIMKFRLLIQR